MSDLSAPLRRSARALVRSSAAIAAPSQPFASAEQSAAFWNVSKRDRERKPKEALHALLERVKANSPVQLFDAVEQGVPTSIVLLLAGAFGQPVASVMQLMGVSETTFRRKEEAGESLPEVAGYRAMGLLRVMSTLQQLLQESGDPALLPGFDLEAWVSAWIRTPVPALHGKTPADMLRNPEGQRAVEDLLERMRGGLVA